MNLAALARRLAQRLDAVGGEVKARQTASDADGARARIEAEIMQGLSGEYTGPPHPSTPAREKLIESIEEMMDEMITHKAEVRKLVAEAERRRAAETAAPALASIPKCSPAADNNLGDFGAGLADANNLSGPDEPIDGPSGSPLVHGPSEAELFGELARRYPDRFG